MPVRFAPHAPMVVMHAERNIHKLRQSIAAQERQGAQAWPAVSLGEGGFDSAMAPGGIGLGALHEFLPASYGDFSALSGFCFGILTQILRIHTGVVLLAVPAFQQLREGAFYPPGLAAYGCDPDRLIQVKVQKSQNVLWALEEGLENAAISAVIGVLPGNDRIYDFTASRRLAMRASETGATALLLRDQHDADFSTAAETRWSVAAAPSEARAWPGMRIPRLEKPQWRVSLTKSKRGASGSWRIGWDYEAFSFRLDSPLADRTPGAAPGDQAWRGWAAAS